MRRIFLAVIASLLRGTAWPFALIVRGLMAAAAECERRAYA
jgi:hypothetical protein